MHNELLNRTEAVTPIRKRIRELAERTSNGTRIRLYWRQGTRDLWVEIWEPELDVTIEIPAAPSARSKLTTTRMRMPPPTTPSPSPPNSTPRSPADDRTSRSSHLVPAWTLKPPGDSNRSLRRHPRTQRHASGSGSGQQGHQPLDIRQRMNISGDDTAAER